MRARLLKTPEAKCSVTCKSGGWGVEGAGFVVGEVGACLAPEMSATCPSSPSVARHSPGCAPIARCERVRCRSRAARGRNPRTRRRWRCQACQVAVVLGAEHEQSALDGDICPAAGHRSCSARNPTIDDLDDRHRGRFATVSDDAHECLSDVSAGAATAIICSASPRHEPRTMSMLSFDLVRHAERQSPIAGRLHA